MVDIISFIHFSYYFAQIQYIYIMYNNVYVGCLLEYKVNTIVCDNEI